MSVFTKTKASDILTYHIEASELLGKPMWVVTEPFEYRIGSLDSDKMVNIHKGFLTDGSSLPKSLMQLAQPWAENGLAVIVHDYLYNYKRIQQSDGWPIAIDHSFADEIFTEALSVLGVSKHKRVIVKVGLVLWRMFNAYRTKAPVELPMAKSAIEESIRLNLERGDSRALTTSQISDLKRDYPMLKKAGYKASRH